MKTFAGLVLYVFVMGLLGGAEALLEEQEPEVAFAVFALAGVIWLAVRLAQRRARREAGPTTAELLSELYPPVTARPPADNGNHDDVGTSLTGGLP